MTYDTHTRELSATPTELLETLDSNIFNTIQNIDYTQVMCDMLCNQPERMTSGQLDWIRKTRIEYLNRRKRPNRINTTTNYRPINKLVLDMTLDEDDAAIQAYAIGRTLAYEIGTSRNLESDLHQTPS